LQIYINSKRKRGKKGEQENKKSKTLMLQKQKTAKTCSGKEHPRRVQVQRRWN
jgi:hypothetical protein